MGQIQPRARSPSRFQTNYDNVDIHFNTSGDISIQSAHVKMTDLDQIDYIKDQIRISVQSHTGEWQYDLGCGSNISDLIGEPNNKDTAELIKSRIISNLVSRGIVKQSDLEVTVIPIDIHSVLLGVTVKAQPTVNNSLVEGQFTVNFLFDFTEFQISPIEASIG